jgi:hypothetical protein
MEIDDMIRKANNNIRAVSDDINDHIERYGGKTCDYLDYRYQKIMFHKGELNALTKLRLNQPTGEVR